MVAAPGSASAPGGPRDPWRVALVAVSMLTAVVAVVVIAVIVAVRGGDGQNGDGGAQGSTAATATATAAPGRSVAPTATPKPGEAAYTNRFDAGSQIPAVNSGTVRLEGGQLVLEHAAEEPSVAKITVPQPYADVTVAVRALSTTDMIILACRHRGSNIQYRAYIKQATQRFAIDLWNLDETDLVPWTTSTAIPKDSFASIAFTCKGPTLTLAVNGTTLAQTTNNVLTDGSVWIGLNGVQGEASSARFDDLVVSRQ